MSTLTNYEQSLGLKEIGFNEPTQNLFFFDCDNTYFMGSKEDWAEDFNSDASNWNALTDHISRPTLNTAAYWLREHKGIHVSVRPISCDWEYTIWQCKNAMSWEQVEQDIFTSHDKALSEGITRAIALKQKEGV